VGVAALAASTTLTALKTLKLKSTRVTGAGFRSLAASPVLSTVTDLALGGNAVTPAAAEDLATALAGSPHLRNLTRLYLGETAVNDRVAQTLATAEWRLSRLTLSSTGFVAPAGRPRMTVTGLEALAGSRFADSLETLNLSGNPIGDAGAELLQRFPR